MQEFVKDMSKMFSILLLLYMAGFTFEAIAEEPAPPPVINNTYCAPSVVVVCRSKGGELICEAHSSVADVLPIPEDY